jgi:hypothetical protein
MHLVDFVNEMDLGSEKGSVVGCWSLAVVTFLASAVKSPSSPRSQRDR